MNCAQACGRSNGSSRARLFGFAEFESPEAMVPAIELLNRQEFPSLELGQLTEKLLVGGFMLCSSTVF